MFFASAIQNFIGDVSTNKNPFVTVDFRESFANAVKNSAVFEIIAAITPFKIFYGIIGDIQIHVVYFREIFLVGQKDTGNNFVKSVRMSFLLMGCCELDI